MMDDAQFGIIKILRPYNNYTADYQGTPTVTPIMFTEGGLPLDAAAGTPGYSPFLIRGLSVPLGARLTIWLPIIFGASETVGVVTVWYYKWSFIWRLRNVFDYRDQRKAYHYPKQGVGVSDIFNPPPNDRVVIPAGVHSVLYAQPRPELFSSNSFGPTAINQADLVMVSDTNNPQAPLIPGGHFGYTEQGLIPVTSPTSQQNSSYITYEVQSEGDELLIGVTRNAVGLVTPPSTPGSSPIWDFGANGADNIFASFLDGSPDIGVYVTSGKAG